MSSLTSAACQDFKNEVLTGNVAVALKKLETLKEALLDCDSLPPLVVSRPNADVETAIAKEILEYAVILSIKAGDKSSFQRYMGSLRPYYTAERTTGSATSDIEYTILGLNLLYLLVENRLADFHCELELLTEQQQSHPAIAFCTKLDQHLMVGSYDQVMSAASVPPVDYYSFFLKSLLETVRINIGECAAASYTSLTVAEATKILMFATEKETIEFIKTNYPGWEVIGNNISLQGIKTTKSNEIPSLKLISQTLSYATELERIV